MSRKKNIIKLSTKINKIRSKKVQSVNETKNWLFEKINMTNKPLGRLIKKEKDTINKNRNKIGEVATTTREIQIVIIKYYK